MMKKLCLLLVMAMMSCGVAMAKDNYGFIDLPYILKKYPAAVSANKSITQKETEISKLLNDANKKIAATKDANTKKMLEDSAKKQIQPKLDSLQAYKKQQNSKVEASINGAISRVAKNYNYALILNGNSVVYGATNVSDLVLKELGVK